MNIKHKAFPFIVTASNKTSKAGNDYLSIGLGQSKKLQEPDSDGNNYETIWMNFIDKRDLLVLASAATSAYNKIIHAENAEHNTGTTKPTKPATDDAFDDDIPF